MKKITLLFAFLITSMGFSQEVIQSFEAAGAVNGGPFGGMAAPTVLVGTGSNTTQVLEIVGNTATDVWQGINLNLTKNVEVYNTQSMSIDVKSSTPITFLVKVNAGVAGAPEAAAAVTHNGDGTWQTLPFTFNTSLDGKAAAANGVYAGFVIHAYWAPGATGFGDVTKDTRTFYVDNIFGIAAAPVVDPAPTTAPTTPPARPAADVISLYSGAYTPAATISNVPWDDSTFEEVTIAGNQVLKISGANFIGMDLDQYLDATSMTFLHMDYWIAPNWSAGMVLNPKLSNHAAQAGETSAIDITNIINSQAEIQNWQSKDFPLNTGTRGSIKQFLITQAGFAGLYYLDNVYLHKNTTLAAKDFQIAGLKVYPNPSKDSWTIQTSNIKISTIQVYDILGKNVLTVSSNATQEKINASSLKAGMYFAKINTANGSSSIKLVKE